MQNIACAENHNKKMLAKITPDHIKLQYAGGIGVLSLAGGWEYGKKNIWETDIYMGYLPKFESKNANLIIAIKQLLSPFLITKNPFSIEPLTTSLGVSYIFGKEFYTFRSYPEYEPGYYKFPTSTNLLFSAGQRINYYIPKPSFIDTATLFYDINTNIFYIESTIKDSALKFKDILNISFGIKIHLSSKE
jgi:hypothetical protein